MVEIQNINNKAHTLRLTLCFYVPGTILCAFNSGLNISSIYEVASY